MVDDVRWVKKDAGPLAYTTRPIVGNYTNEEENR